MTTRFLHTLTILGAALLLAPLHPCAAEACGADSWNPLPGTPPPPRAAAAAVWTGQELIVWGGQADPPWPFDGARFDPATGAWTPLPSAPALAARRNPGAVWTGSEMILWGGEGESGPLGDGARFNPATGQWTALPADGSPSPRSGHLVAWTGTEMIVWGGLGTSGPLGDGARYNPASNQWTPITATLAPAPRREPAAAWTGTELLVWGGADDGGPLADGARYTPAPESWNSMESTGAPAARFGAPGVWTGTELLVWGGHDGAGPLATGGRYNPAENSWSPLPGAGAPAPRFSFSAAWTGYEMVIWGGEDGANSFDNGARFQPGTNLWLPMTLASAPAPRAGQTAVWTGRQMLVWGGFSGTAYLNSGGAYCACAQAPAPADGACDGLDADCDGTADEDYSAETTQCGEGTCARNGLSSCENGAVQANCTPGPPEGPDTDCDGTDDDCDGQADEDFVPYPTDCGLGICRRSGLATCGAGEIHDSCLPGAPGLEACDGLDNDCDGSLDEDRGTRYVAPLDKGGNDAGNTCLSRDLPCFSITHANTMACDHETVMVAEGVYLQDVDITRPLTVDAEGVPTLTIINGTGTRDVVKILSGDVLWTGVDVFDTPHVACVRVGDPDHPGLRNVRFENTAIANCAIGVIWDSTGHPGPGGAWNSYLASSTREMVYDGSPDSGTGTLLINGNGKIDFRVGRLAHNQGSGLVIKAAPPGKENREIVFSGVLVWDNGNHPAAPGKSGIEVHGANQVRFEGNTFKEHSGSPGEHDARALLLEGVVSGTFNCNRVYNNDDGVVLTAGTTGIPFLQNQFDHHTGSAVAIGPGTGPGLSFNENRFQANARGLDHLGTGLLNAKHNWWGAADGPSGPGGSGDPVYGTVDVTGYIARATAPVLVRRPQDSGWDPSPDYCFWSVQPAVNYAAPGDLILVGAGRYFEHITVDKPLDIEGVDGGAACSPSIIDGEQSGPPYRPGLRLSGVSGATVRQLTIRGAGKGVACGTASGEQIGLDLVGVSRSAFSNLCLMENGVTEVRLFGNADDNLLATLTIDGMWRGMDGSDACGHRSREGVLIDGSPACEGGPGALAQGNRISNTKISNCTRSIGLRLAGDTEISGNTLKSLPAPAWPGEPATGIAVAVSSGTSILDNFIGNAGMDQGIRVEGKRAGACLSEAADSAATTIAGNQIQQAGQGIRVFRDPGDPGAPKGTTIVCNNFTGNATAVRTDYVGPAGGTQNVLLHCDIAGNGAGAVNFADDPLPALGNWWGAISGPSGSGPGTGNSVAGAIDFSPWLVSPSQEDADADGVSECNGDCNDASASVRPGATEICDGLDNDCDGQADNGLPPPGGPPALAAARTGAVARLSWSGVAPATGYDVTRGLVSILLSTAGDYSAAAQTCLAGNTALLTVDDSAVPAAGDAVFYLLRARNCLTPGTFDEPEGRGEVASRDQGVNASAGNCVPPGKQPR